jgi:hypothetical protein
MSSTVSIPAPSLTLARTKSLLPLLLIAAPAIVKLLYYPTYIGSDDSYIHLQVAHNVLLHHTWGIAPYVRCNLSTSPLFTILLIVLEFFFHTHAVVVAQILSALACSLGIFALYRRTILITGSTAAACLAAGTSALACNLWRWNGTLMESTFAFAAIAVTLLLFASPRLSTSRASAAGLLLGLSVLLRPELLCLAALCILYAAVFTPSSRTAVILPVLVAGLITPIAAWLLFSWSYFHQLLPTSYYAKTISGILLWNPDILHNYAELAAFSLFWPVLLLLLILISLKAVPLRQTPRHLILPIASFLLISTFYYLRTPGLESPGRYLFPLFALFSAALGDLFGLAMQTHPQRRWSLFCAIILALHGITSIVMNQRFIAPALQAFQTQYFVSMRDASEYLAQHMQPTDRALVEIDIGVIAYTANGRFLIADGGGLASPELDYQSVSEQIAHAKPLYVVQSQGTQPGQWKDIYPGLHPVWNSRYRGHGISNTGFLYVNIYQVNLGEIKVVRPSSEPDPNAPKYWGKHPG